MATQNKKRSSSTKGKSNYHNNRKTSGNKKVHKNKKEEDTNRQLYHDEIALIITLVVSLLLILSNFNLSGSFGVFINKFTFGMLGVLAFLLPFCLFFSVAFYIANRGSRVALRKLISGIFLSISLAAFIQLISSGSNLPSKLIDFYTMSSQNRNGGGIIGGSICMLLHPLFGTFGSYIVLIGLIFVTLMFITGKTLFAYLGSVLELYIKQKKEQRRLLQEEYLAQAGDTNPNELVKRRPAKTVVLQKNQNATTDSGEKEELNSTLGVDSSNQKGLFNRFKKKNDQNLADTNLNNPNSTFEMEEIKVQDIDIPIQRSNTYQNGTSSSKNGIDDQVQSNNGSHLDDQDIDNINELSRNLDKDIERLLKAAGEDPEVNQSSALKNEVMENSQVNSQNSGIVKQEDKIRGNNLNNHEIDKSEANDLSNIQIVEEKKEYTFPPVTLLSRPKANVKGMSDSDLKETALKLQKTLESFGVHVAVTNVSCGPAVTRYELQPEQGVKVSRITSLADDIKLNLAAADIRIEAPIPGKAAVGIEVPNKENTSVMLRELIETKEFKTHSSDIAFAVGKDIGGQTVVADIGKMPHLLIAGATGSGKSVCINTLIMSILYKSKPSDVRLIMIDPKVVELSVYNGIPHLLIPVVTDPKKASGALNWAVMEMTERYKKFADIGVRDVKGYNEKIATVEEYHDEKYQKLPQIVIIVDELADLMMVAPGEVEDSICRLAQMARAAGLHLIIATQRPSVNVITGLIKANIPSRIAFSVSSAIDSRTIIDGSGAEKLLGKGDMLFFPSGYPKPVRIQGAFVSDKEVGAVVEFLTSQNQAAEYSEEVANKIISAQSVESSAASSANDRDDYFIEAGKFIIDKDKASIGMLQRVYKIGFNRAARIMDQLAEAGVVGPEEGTKPRKILMSMEEFEQFIDECV